MLSTFLCVFNLSACLPHTHHADLSMRALHKNILCSCAQPEICRGRLDFKPSQTPQSRKVGSKFDMLRDSLIRITVGSHEPQFVMQDLIKAQLSGLKDGFVRRTSFTEPVSVVFDELGDSVTHMDRIGNAANLINSRIAHTSLLLRWILARSLNSKPRLSAESKGKGKKKESNLKNSFQAKLAKLQSKLKRSRTRTADGKLSEKMDEAISGEQQFRKRIDRLLSRHEKQRDINSRSSNEDSSRVPRDEHGITDSSQFDDSGVTTADSQSSIYDHRRETPQVPKSMDQSIKTVEGAMPKPSPNSLDAHKISVSPKGNTASESMLNKLREEISRSRDRKSPKSNKPNNSDRSGVPPAQPRSSRSEPESARNTDVPRGLGRKGDQRPKARPDQQVKAKDKTGRRGRQQNKVAADGLGRQPSSQTLDGLGRSVDEQEKSGLGRSTNIPISEGHDHQNPWDGPPVITSHDQERDQRGDRLSPTEPTPTSLSEVLRSELNTVIDYGLQRRLATRAQRRMYRLQVAGVDEQVSLNIIKEELREAKDYHYELVREAHPSSAQKVPPHKPNHFGVEGRADVDNDPLEQSQHVADGVTQEETPISYE